MKTHLQYLSYVVRHKTFVLMAGLRTRAPLWRLLIHDWSKFLPSEWIPYARYFYGPKEVARWHPEYTTTGPDLNERYQAMREDTFDRAWLAHQHRNPHHWQHWILAEDTPSDPTGNPKVLEMPEHFAREMVADWMGAGRAITGKWDVWPWYSKNCDRIKLHDNTRALVVAILDRVRPA